MSRTRADALALVNWKGVFYERYLLDRHVTALEGSNGAGKTTVMIAAYVALLPDMSRLRFTNLGETGATGGDKGIWGRLGDPGRLSYVVVDFALAGTQRLLAGVHLERKGEPSVEPTPFIVWGLDAVVRLQDLLLVLGSRRRRHAEILAGFWVGSDGWWRYLPWVRFAPALTTRSCSSTLLIWTNAAVSRPRCLIRLLTGKNWRRSLSA